MNISTTQGDTQETIDECHTLQREEFEVIEVSHSVECLAVLGSRSSFELQSIYPEYVTNPLNEGILKLEVPVDFEESHDVSIVAAQDDVSPIQVAVSSLPPIFLHIHLPPGYPVFEPPQIVSSRATHAWLVELEKLNSHLTDMWQAGDGVLYMWSECLRTGEFLSALGYTNPSSVIQYVSCISHPQIRLTPTVRLTHPHPESLAALLADNDQQSKSSQFAKNTYPCSVCLTTLKGSRCLRLSCQHIFCRDCLQDFWGMCIQEGDVSRVGCPDPECVKQKREADEEEVARVVSEEEVERWKWLLEKRDLDRGAIAVVTYRILITDGNLQRSYHRALPCRNLPGSCSKTS